MESTWTEIRTVKHAARISADIAHDLKSRLEVGPAVVIVEKPNHYLTALRKHWVQLKRLQERERAATLSVWLREEIQLKALWMESVKFVVTTERGKADVYVVSPEQAAQVLAFCATAYFVLPVDDATLNTFLRGKDRDLLVVRYELDDQPSEPLKAGKRPAL